MSILIWWFFLVGLITGLFFSRLAKENRSWEGSISFSTQSVWNNEWTVLQTYTIVCPWAEEILWWNTVYMWNPLVDTASELLSIQQWLVSQNYYAYGPIGWNGSSWKASFMRHAIQSLEAIYEWNNATCEYSVWSTKLFSLRQSDVGNNCEVVNSPQLVWFTCEK